MTVTIHHSGYLPCSATSTLAAPQVTEIRQCFCSVQQDGFPPMDHTMMQIASISTASQLLEVLEVSRESRSAPFSIGMDFCCFKVTASRIIES